MEDLDLSVVDHESFYRDNSTKIDARSFSEVKNTFLQYLSDEGCPTNIKVGIGEWFFRTVYMFFKLRGPDKLEVCEKLYSPIQNTKEIKPKSLYLNYTDMEASSLLCLYFFFHRFEESYFIVQLLNDANLLKGYLLNANLDDEELKDHFLEWIKHPDAKDDQQSNILDILLKYFPNDPEVKRVYRKLRFGGGVKDIGNDAQTVHDVDISEATIKAATELFQWGKQHPIVLNPGQTITQWAVEYVMSLLGQDPLFILECVFTRTAIDKTSFNGFDIGDIFFTTLAFVQTLPLANQADVLQILMEEMDEGKDYCASGYIARCITSLQGQSDRFQMTIPFSKSLNMIITSKLSLGMIHVDEDVIAGITDAEHRPAYLRYVENTVNEVLPALVREHGVEKLSCISGVLSDITDSVWTFSGTHPYRVFRSDEEKLV